MCKKLFFLVLFVLVLGSVSSAENIQWTDLGADHLWSNPENWDLGRVPAVSDEVRIDVPAAAEPNGPVIEDGIAAMALGLFNEAAGEPTLTMTGGSLLVANWIWWGDGADCFGVWNMSGGTVDVINEFELGWGGGAGTLTMTGGTINVGKAVIPTGSGAFGELFLQGGTYSVTRADGLQMNANGLIDITEGTLVLEGDDTAKVNGLIAAGQITAYGGEGAIDLDFDVRNPGKTTLTAIEGVVFLFDNFESYADDAGLTAAGWTIFDTPEATETGTTWTITNPGGRTNPATLDGSASTGKFLISDSDSGDGSNPVDSGASHDVTTPSFSTAGADTVWLHMDLTAQLNNNGSAIFDVDVSIDGGGTWTNAFSRVAPGRASAEGATTRLPDNTNTDGYYGQLDVDLTPYAADQNDVQLRIRHYEPNDDWYIALDNIRVDNNPAPQGGSTTVFSEDFSNGLGQMNAVSGQGNTGTETWHTTDKGGRYVPGTVQERGVNRLGPHPGATPDFAIMDSDTDPDPNEDEWLMTPSLDLSGLAEVFLHYDSETVMSSGVWNQEVLVSLDGGTTFEATPIFAYTGGGLFDNGEEPAYAERIFDVSGTAAGQRQVVFAFRYTGDGDDWWWAIDNVEVSGTPAPVDSGTDGLVALYALDGDAIDSSGNELHGMIVGEPNFVEGRAGMALELDGIDDYVDCGNPTLLDFGTGDFTVSAWIRLTTTERATVFAKGGDDGGGIRYTLAMGESNDNKMTLTTDDDSSKRQTKGDTVVNDGAWHHVVGMREGNTGFVYVDGVLDGSLELPEGYDLSGSSQHNALIGAITSHTDGSLAKLFAGTIDDVRVYGRALSRPEVAFLALKGNIIWVSFHGADDVPSDGAAGAGFTEAADKAYTDLLTDNGYKVKRYVTTSSPDPDVLNAADLVIISRSVASGGYQNDGATAWNSISAPMIITGGYTTRSSRMGFTTGGTMVDTTGDITLTVNDPTHPIFAGIELIDGAMVNPFAGVVVYPTDGVTLARGISVNNDELNAEGTLLATVSTVDDPTVGGMVIAEWQAGATLTHSGGAGTDTLAGHRLVFLTGAREADGINSETSGLYDLYADGAQMFLNAVSFMLGN